MANILIVEDDGKTANRIGKHLQAAGHRCYIAVSGKEALEAAKTGPCDLVILDIMLPDVSGFEVCRRIRKDPDTFALPILVVSAMNEEEEVLHGLAQGADDYVTKPFDMRDVVHRTQTLLQAGAKAEMRDELTQLPGSYWVKRELQRRVSDRKPFALGYVELIHLRAFAAHQGAAARDKAIRHLGRLLEACGKEIGGPGFFVGHMGGGHFVCFLPPGKAKACSTIVRKQWLEHRPTLYAGAKADDADRDVSSGLLDIRFFVTNYRHKEALSSNDLFEVLIKMRARASTEPDGGAFVDQRTR